MRTLAPQVRRWHLLGMGQGTEVGAGEVAPCLGCPQHLLGTVSGSISWSLFHVGAGRARSHSWSSGTRAPCPVSLPAGQMAKAQQPPRWEPEGCVAPAVAAALAPSTAAALGSSTSL